MRRLLLLVLVAMLYPAAAPAQQYQQVQSAPLSAPSIGGVIDETRGGATIHTLSWTIVGTPTACTIAIETSTTAAGVFTPVGAPFNCTRTGSSSVSGLTATFIRINLSAFAGSGASITYTYIAEGALAAATFANADLWAKLDALRAVEALRHGIGQIQKCPLSNVVGDAAVPTEEQFQLYSEPFASTLGVAASFGDTGASGIPSAQNSIQTEALAQIRFDSGHYFYHWEDCLSHRPTFSFGGTVGLTPALVLENLTSTTETIANPKNRPMFQDSFAWSLTPRINIATSHNSELNGFVTLGEKYLISQVTSFKQGDNTVVATPVSNNVGQSALYWESGVEWKLLNTDIVNAYINKTDVIDPPFDIAVGYRNDTRFKGVGDLAGFSNPQSYMFLRFTVGLNKIVNWSSNTVDPGKGYTFKFGIDYEHPISDSRMPTATLYYVSANFDIMKVFKPSTQTTQQPAPTAGGSTPAPAAPKAANAQIQ